MTHTQILLEFIGGRWDGMNLCTTTADAIELRLASYVFLATESACPGRRVVMPLDYATARSRQGGNEYVVIHRQQAENETLVRLECLSDVVVGDPAVTGEEVRQVLVEFQGGCLGSERLDSRAENLDEALLAMAYYCLTDGGKPGKFINCLIGACKLMASVRGRPLPSPHAEHVYRVDQCREDRERVVIHLSHISEGDKSPDSARR